MNIIEKQDDFIDILACGDTISDYVFKPIDDHWRINKVIFDNIHFKNCIFFGTIIFEDLNDLKFGFEVCSFKGSINFYNCDMRSLAIHEPVELSGNFYSIHTNIDITIFASGRSINSDTGVMFQKKTLSGSITFNHCTFSKSIQIECYITGELSIHNSTFLDSCRTFFQNSVLNFFYFENNNINCAFKLTNISIICKEEEGYHGRFESNIFSKSLELNQCVIDEYFEIKNCNINDNLILSEIKKVDNKANLFRITDCSINGFARITNCNIYNFSLEKIHCSKNMYFENSEFEELFLLNLKFDRFLYLQDITIHQLEKSRHLKSSLATLQKWKITFRTIKQELQKAENKIDYNRFRAYELEAYYRELTWRKNFKDWFILSATKVVTGFDHSWQKALLFTLAAGLLFYSMFFISENYFNQFDVAGWKKYASGYFRFLLVTDFYSPLENGRTYIHNSNTIGWFLFILGKIVIAFGIYEMIQAFRKFKS